MKRRLSILLGLMLVAGPLAAHDAVLSEAGTDLGRVLRSDLPAGLEIPVAIDGYASEGFIVARFQNNQPLMKTADGVWTPWDGDIGTLERVTVAMNNGAARFTVGTWPTPDVLAPCTFTFGYWSEGVLKFGYVTVDAS